MSSMILGALILIFSPQSANADVAVSPKTTVQLGSWGNVDVDTFLKKFKCDENLKLTDIIKIKGCADEIDEVEIHCIGTDSPVRGLDITINLDRRIEFSPARRKPRQFLDCSDSHGFSKSPIG